MNIPDWKLERYLLGELPPLEAAEIRKRESVDDILRLRLEKLRQSNADILAQYPSDRLISVIKSRIELHEKKNTMPKWPLVMAATLLCIVIPFVASPKDIVNSLLGKDVSPLEIQKINEDGTRIKGMGPRLEVWLKKTEDAEQLNEMSEVKAGDEIQLRYAVPTLCYALLVSLDGRNTVTVHLAKGDSAIPVEPGKMNTLPFAYKLDDAPHFEKFFFFVSSHPFKISQQNLDSLLKQKEIQSVSFTLRKIAEKKGK
jgi:hypothetical protein